MRRTWNKVLKRAVIVIQNEKMLTVNIRENKRQQLDISDGDYLCAMNVKDGTFKEKCIQGITVRLRWKKRKALCIKVMKQKRKKIKVISEYINQLRMNRSIRAEGSFANVKEDMNFREYLYRGKENVTAQV